MHPNRYRWEEWCKALEAGIGSTEPLLEGSCLHKQLQGAVEHRMIGILVVVVVEHHMVGLLEVVEHRMIGILMAVVVEGGTTGIARE